MKGVRLKNLGGLVLMNELVVSWSIYEKKTLITETRRLGKISRGRALSAAESSVIITASLHFQKLRETKRRSVLKVRLASF
jgi:hypothetical protein